MNKKQILENALHSIGCLNDAIDMLEKIGLSIDDSGFGGLLYQSYNGIIDIAMSCLTFDDIGDRNQIDDMLLSETTVENYLNITEEVWAKYGSSENI